MKKKQRELAINHSITDYVTQSKDKKSDDYKNHKILIENSLKNFLELHPDEKKKRED
jgi:hypothetical protein